MSENIYYYLAPGIDVVPLNDNQILFRSDVVNLRIEGGFAQILRDRVLPQLDGTRSLHTLAEALPDLPLEILKQRLDELERAQVLRQTSQPLAVQNPSDAAASSFFEFLAPFGITAEMAQSVLNPLRIGIVGLEGPGGYLAEALSKCRIGHLLLIDPYPCQPGNLATLPLLGPDAIGVPRQQALQAALQARGSSTVIEVGPSQDLTRETLVPIATTCQLLVGAFDRGFASVNHWINQISLAHDIPALYAEVGGPHALVGPFVLPGQTACYMCYRMRSMACEDDFDSAMQYEEFLDRAKRPALHKRGILPAVPSYVASLMTFEILKQFLVFSQSTLAGKILEFQPLSLQTIMHPVLQEPDCIACGKKKPWIRSHPLIDDQSLYEPAGDLLAAAPYLVSKYTGIIRTLTPITPDPTEPPQPFVVGAKLANHRFAIDEPPDFRVCSGKGMTREAVRISTFGEAVERYSGARWRNEEVTYSLRDELPGASLDPRELVLYAPEQYADLPYKPYTGQTRLGWVQGRSLVSGGEVFVPAQGVFMTYSPHTPDEFLCPITSNGLAAGSTLAHAILAAAGEVLERDAFMITWLNQLVTQRVDPWTHPDGDTLHLCEMYRRRGVAVELYRLPVDHPCHVFLAIGVQVRSSDAPAAIIGLGADLHTASAARKAIMEVGQVRPTLRRRLRDPSEQTHLAAMLADPRQVTTLKDHDLLYADPKSLDALQFLRNRPIEPFAWSESTPETIPQQLQRLVDHLHNKGQDLIYYNLTPPDMEAFHLYTARVIIPGFQPISFGWNELRLGGERLYTLPQQLGLLPRRTELQQLNRYPHPLA